MNEADILGWFESTGFGAFLRDVTWAWPLFETLHFVGLCVLFGALLVVDLRVLGLGKHQMPIAAVIPFSHVALFGFALNVITGAGFFCAKPANYWGSDVFKWKMALVAVGGINALAFEFVERRRLGALAVGVDADVPAKAIAVLSLSVWIVVIALGRLLPFTGSIG